MLFPSIGSPHTHPHLLCQSRFLQQELYLSLCVTISVLICFSGICWICGMFRYLCVQISVCSFEDVKCNTAKKTPKCICCICRWHAILNDVMTILHSFFWSAKSLGCHTGSRGPKSLFRLVFADVVQCSSLLQSVLPFTTVGFSFSSVLKNAVNVVLLFLSFTDVF